MNLVFVSVSFKVILPGHNMLLRFELECGDRLIVGVYSDKMAGLAAHISEELRLEGVRANSWVDEAFLIEDSVIKSIDKLKPDIVINLAAQAGVRYSLKNPKAYIESNIIGLSNLAYSHRRL